ncbi:MAG TPA: DAHL domain-containing protein [Polyangiaceae bacterium]
MTSTRWFALIAALFLLAFAGSGFLYARSQSADYDAHARAIAAIGRARHLDRLLSEQVLEARFGLLNQYDPITSTELDLFDEARELRARLVEVVGQTPELDRALAEFDRAVEERRSVVERFKGENSILKNSLRYLPTAADESSAGIAASAGKHDAELARDLNGLVRAALVYNLIGDRSTREVLEHAVEKLTARKTELGADAAPQFELLLAHARVIGERQPSVDALVKQASSDAVAGRLLAVENLYDARFSRAAASADRYRQILYVWSLCLVIAVAITGVLLLRMYAGLERRVAERTAELGRALDALWGEMKLARKIQEALVPAQPALTGCEVAASMKPADEVGGDYYDVIRSDDHEWILIGDVSGHGVPAGLIMMMCQTAVRTALERDPKMTPDRLLVLVNSVLTQNIRQLGEDKYMTISALRRDPDGTICFAGAHQDIFVYRADTDDVETFETSGLWLGIKPNAEGSFTTRDLRLGTGDVLVLHTDGVTEAMRDGALFDCDGMRRVLKAAKGKSARQILDGVLGALEGFELKDDATLLIVRQVETGAARRTAAEPAGVALGR